VLYLETEQSSIIPKGKLIAMRLVIFQLFLKASIMLLVIFYVSW
jgi:hypothetical protein